MLQSLVLVAVLAASGVTDLPLLSKPSSSPAPDRALTRTRPMSPQVEYIVFGPTIPRPATPRQSRSAASPSSACAPILNEAFDRDPFATGRFTVIGPGRDQVQWRRGEVEIEYDSARPTTRIEAPLDIVLSGDDCFRFGVVFTIDSVDAGPDDFFQIAFGLSNRLTTGSNRTGTAPAFGDADTYDYVELSYFPNVTPFGGPFLSPSVFGSATPPGDAFANFTALFGTSADLGDNPAPLYRALPTGARMQAELKYEPSSGLMTTSLIDLSADRPTVIELATTPLDLALVNAIDTFEVDALSITSYFDAADFDPSTRSLHARVRYHEVFVAGCCP